jgi:hypothetical protein
MNLQKVQTINSLQHSLEIVAGMLSKAEDMATEAKAATEEAVERCVINCAMDCSLPEAEETMV